jgi:cytochrome b561
MDKQITQYSSISKLMHWLMAVLILLMFGVGYWMVDLTYYSAWYKTAPHYHKSVGVVLALLLLVRLGTIWRVGKPAALSSHSRWEQWLAKLTHSLLYLLLIAIMLTGYLISTEDGRGIEVFNWFVLPGLGELFAGQADIAGDLHEWFAYSLMALVLLHAAGAIKHHLLDKDATLRRMWWSQTKNSVNEE